jgi:hypothetical protein
MFENYLADIEYLLRDGAFGEAVPLALALPNICAALESQTLRSSREQYLHWCESWVRPSQSDTTLSVPSSQALYELACERGALDELGTSAGVPVQALRQLRLRRLSRAAPPRPQVAPADGDAAGDGMREACAALVTAVRRWYWDWAALDPTVQYNLARLAVLR